MTLRLEARPRPSSVPELPERIGISPGGARAQVLPRLLDARVVAEVPRPELRRAPAASQGLFQRDPTGGAR